MGGVPRNRQGGQVWLQRTVKLSLMVRRVNGGNQAMGETLVGEGEGHTGLPSSHTQKGRVATGQAVSCQHWTQA